jgi:hypothetical protein
MSLPVKFEPLETDIGESEQTDDGRDDGGEYYDDEYGRDGGSEYDEYPYDDDDDNMNDHRDAVPLVGSTASSLHERVETLVDPERRAICWPVYLVVALCIGLLTAAVVLVPPADADESNAASTTPSATPSASPSAM